MRNCVVKVFGVLLALGVGQGAAAAEATAAPVSSNGVNATVSLTTDWGSGYCANVILKNASSAEVASWTVVVELGQSALSGLWNGTVGQSGTQITVKPAGWNSHIAPGQLLTAFGFCANKGGGSYQPSLVSIAVDGGSAAEGGGTPDGDGTSGDASDSAANVSASCPTALQGFAAVSGDGVSTTTGGGGATPVRPTTAAQLTAYASDSQARVIEIAGTFDVPRLDVKSNKTLIGIGTNATINGGVRIRGSSSAFVKNVIVRNLRINGSPSDVDGDAMQIHYAHHVWADHCEIWDAPDGNLDIVHGSNWVTVSWTKFRYTSAAPASDHKFSNLIGHSDSNTAEDSGRLKVTLHHDWWAEGVVERMPRVRFGQVHAFNNYFTSSGNNYCIRAGRDAHILAERNYFQGVKDPLEFNSSADQATANITARDNVFKSTSGSQSTGGGGAAFTNPPYSAAMDAASNVPSVVQSCVGPR
jgi:pectate lyase